MSSIRRPLSRALESSVRCWLPALLAALPAVAFAQSATPAVSTLAAFSGSQTSASPVRGPDGALYGVSSVLNLVTGGLIYRLESNGSSIETIYQLRLEDAYSPNGGLLLGSDGKLYGTTSLGAATDINTSGTVYRLNTDGSGFSVLHRFASYTSVNSIGNPINTDGANPESELIEGADGYLYGVARAGGPTGNGVVFRITKEGTDVRVLHAFGATTSDATTVPVLNVDGIGPIAPLVLGADNYLYGTTPRGGAAGYGTIFRVRLDGTGFELLRTFPTLVDGETADTNVDGAAPLAGLTDGQDGRLYGVTSAGGSTGNGTIFAYDPVGGVFSVLHDFDGTKGAQPSGELLLAQDGKLYGTTSTGGTSDNGSVTLFGTIFSIARDGTGFTSLHSFEGSDGSTPTGRMLQLDASTFVGITRGGGRCGQGTVFQLSLTGAETKGVTNCGRKNNGGGGGGMAPALLLLLGLAGFARREIAR